jgi:hypothetical protein
VFRARRAGGAIVSPAFRVPIEQLSERALDHNHRIMLLEDREQEDRAMLLDHNHDVRSLQESLEQQMPNVLNAIASSNGTARLLRREQRELAERLDALISRVEINEDRSLRNEERLSTHVERELWPLAARVEGLAKSEETIAWLLQRVETVRAEMLHELRYGRATPEETNEATVHRPELLEGDDIRLNIGCGHIALDGYVNVDMRDLPGVDVVASVAEIPVAPGSVKEIYSAHVLEHFPKLELERKLLPYWRSLLSPGGAFRAVVPDLDAMIHQYQAGDITFEALRSVTYGGQEYTGDFHHNGFTPTSLGELLESTGFERVELVERGRPNGDCLEFEIVAHRPN